MKNIEIYAKSGVKPKTGQVTRQVFYHKLFCLCFIMLTGVDQIGFLAIPKFCFIAFPVVYFCFCDRRFITPTICFMIPLNIWIDGYYTFAIAVVIYVIRFYNLVKIPTGMFLTFLLVTIDLLSFVHGGFSLYVWMRTSVYYTVITFFLFCSQKDVNARTVLLSFTTGYLVVCVLSLVKVVPIVGLMTLISTFRFGSVSLRNILHPLGSKILQENELGIYSAIIVSMMLGLLYRYPKDKLPYITVSVFSVVMAMLAMSNTGFVLLICTVLCYLWSIRTSVKRFAISVFFLIDISGLLYWVINHYYPQLFKSIIRRILVDDISNGRTELLKMYFQKMFENPKYLLFGTGSQNYVDKLQMLESSHNALQHAFIMWGFTGFALVVALVVSAWIFMCEGLPRKARVFIFATPFLLFILGAQSGQFDGSFPLLLPAIYAVRLAEADDG